MSKEHTESNLDEILRSYFPHVPTPGQEIAIHALAELISKKDTKLMVLKGYAGTGKTTLIRSVADVCDALNKKIILLSPTGRGAKVMSEISKRDAFTIHKHIYDFKLRPNGTAIFKLSFNKNSNALFIIDEASMIPGGKNDAGNGGFIIPESGLLRDIFEYISSNNNNKIIMIGDPAQLPPVNHSLSPALNEQYLYKEFDMEPVVVTLREIVRQALDSGILMNATAIRELIETNTLQWPVINTNGFNDIFKPENWQIQEMITDSFSGAENDAVIITVSNKIANKYNEYIRRNVLFREQILDAGDLIMAVKNNYFWLDNSGKDFIANGEMMQVMSVRNTEAKFGFNFADVTVKLVYQKGEPVIDMKVLLDTLHLPAPALPHEQFTELWNKIMKSYGGKITKKKSLEILGSDPYINALQVKFAWAVTCHKSQGGQWKKVFVDTEFLMKRPADISGLRWLYTAITRAQKELVFIR
jgi:exodeoxyribonuclease V